jgi:hypothetical protein
MKDNYPDIWAQRLDPVTKDPLGEAFAVYHFHETRKAPNILGAATFGPAVGKNQITFSLVEQSANSGFGVDPIQSQSGLVESLAVHVNLLCHRRCISTGARCESSLSIRKVHFNGMLRGG